MHKKGQVQGPQVPEGENDMGPDFRLKALPCPSRWGIFLFPECSSETHAYSPLPGPQAQIQRLATFLTWGPLTS